jgi:hypothetical protein
MSVLWVVSVLAFAALMVYRAHLTNQETDELFLSDAEDHTSSRHQEHDLVVNRVARIRPWCQGAGGAAALFTVGIMGVYVARIADTLR